jgi:hypothetical protein
VTHLFVDRRIRAVSVSTSDNRFHEAKPQKSDEGIRRKPRRTGRPPAPQTAPLSRAGRTNTQAGFLA